MGYDRQTSPFGTRIFLTCYCFFLLLNVLLYTNNFSEAKKDDGDNSKTEFRIIMLGIVVISTFTICLYGLWFAEIIILFLIGLLFLTLLCTSLISIVFINANIPSLNFNNNSTVIISLKNSSIYFSHNYLLLNKSSTFLLRILNLSFSCILNVISLCGICHLCSCIEHRHDSWPYRKRSLRPSHAIL